MSGGPWNAPTVLSPCCGAVSHVRSKNGALRKRRCTGCSKVFNDYIVRISRSRGSGQIAGRITIGRGFKWGARTGGSLA